MNLLIILSHKLTEKQKEYALNILKVDNILLLPQELLGIWGNIYPEGEIPIKDLEKIQDWIKQNSNQGDYVLVQGESGATFYLVDFCFFIERIPIYATTKRIVQEYKQGEKILSKRYFEFIKLRKYKKYEK